MTLVAAGPAGSAEPTGQALQAGAAPRPLVVTALDRLDAPPLRAAARTTNAAAPAPEARVGASPDESATPPVAAPAPTSDAITSEDDGLPPLTRAATRRRIESISPVPWLARFGPVSLEQRE